MSGSAAPCMLSGHALAAEIAARRLSPVDIVDDCLTQIERLDPKLQAFVTLMAKEARLAAEAADKALRAGHAVGPLHGIPIAVKDLVEIEGQIAMGGSAAWRNRVATRTATLYRKLMAAGMICLGKTHTVEFAFGGWGTNPHLGTPWNPWDTKTHRIPGGSSSGSAVAVAARMTPWAIGTDTGGSVRLPAAWNGVTGLKATKGRISTYGVLPLMPTLDTPGPIVRDVEDAALLLMLLQGCDQKDHTTLGVRDTDPMPSLRRGVRGLRLARLPESERAGVDVEVLAAYDASLACLADQGAEIIDLSLPGRFTELGAGNVTIGVAEAYTLLGEIAADESQPLDEAVRRRILAGASISARDYLRALAVREEMKADFAAAIEGVDALLTPTTPFAAVAVADIDEAAMPTTFTRAVSYLDMCGLAVPNGMTADGLPTSLQIVCRGYDESMALRIGWAWQSVTDWHARLPPTLEC